MPGHEAGQENTTMLSGFYFPMFGGDASKESEKAKRKKIALWLEEIEYIWRLWTPETLSLIRKSLLLLFIPRILSHKELHL